MRVVLRLGLVAVSVLALAACGGGATPAPTVGPGPTAAAPSAAAPSVAAPSVAASACQKTDATSGGVAVAIKDFSFNPGTISAKVGQAVTFTNQDNINHGAALDDGSCTTGSFGNGKSGSLVFSAPGTYPFHCPVHPSSMSGTIEVTS